MEQFVLKGWIRVLVAMTLVALVSSLALTQATGVVRGAVKDAERGEALIGANVVLTGTTLGAVTDVEGNYVVRNVPEGTYTVSVRYVGYKGQTKEAAVKANASATVDFALAVTAVQMDEVVVTGQGAAIEKRRLPTTVETLSSKDIQLAPVKSVDQLLQGRIPGLMSFAPGGAPGTGTRMITRGVKAALNGTTPVIYVDGVRVDNNPQGRLASATGGQISSSLADLVVGEIDRVEVIKGGAAATLYGSEAANGVIQIFTKKGSPGASRWNVNVTQGYDSPYLKDTWSDYTKTKYYQTGAFQSYRVGVDGGTENLTYTVSGKLSQNTGVSVKNQLDDKLYNISSGIRALLGEKGSVEASASYTRNRFGKQFNDNSSAGVISSLEIEGTMEPQKTSNPDSVLNAYLLPELNETVNRWIASTNFNYNPYTWWQNRFTIGVDYRKSESRQFASIEAGPVVGTTGGYLDRSDREYITVTAAYNAIFALPDFGPVSQRITVGAQAFRVNDREIQGNGSAFKIPGTKDFDNASIITANESNVELFSYGYIFQDQLGVGNTLFLDFGLRIDGNTTFGTNVPAQVYPKVGAAYNISDEEFYPSDFKSIVSNLKLRASYGQTGLFPPPGTRDRSYVSNAYTYNAVADAGINFGNPGNKDLKPEKTSSYDAGFDMGLFDDKVSLEFSYFKQVTKDSRFSVTQDLASGFLTFKSVNIGEIQNSGIELSLRSNIFDSEDFQFNMRAAYSTNDNTVTSMGGAAEFSVAGFSFAPEQVKEGSPVGIIRVSQPRLEANGKYEGNVDLVYLGGPTPTQIFSLGFDMVISKDLTISALAEGAFGHYVLNQSFSRREVNALGALVGNLPGTGNGIYRDILDKIPINSLTGQYYSRNAASSVLAERGDWIKMREISARYRVPREWLGNVYLTASVRNPFVIMKKATNVDPESSFIPSRTIELGGIVGATVQAPIQWRFGIDVIL